MLLELLEAIVTKTIYSMIRNKKGLKMKIFKLALSSILLSSSVMAAGPQVWITSKVIDSIATNMDIYDFLETTRMTDSQKVALFEKAEKNFDKYQELRKEALAPMYESGLRQWTYFKMVEKDAVRDRKTSKSPAFRITETAYFNAAQKIETDATKKYLDQRLGIVKARDLVGAELKQSGYPHKASESNTDVFFTWFNAQKARLKESMRVREIQKHEYFKGTRGFEVYVRPTDMWDFGKSNEALVNEKLNNKRMDKATLLKIVQDNPQLRVTLDTLDSLSISDMSLADIQNINKDEAQALANKIDQSIDANKTTLVANITKYTNIAKQFTEKYNDEQLKQKAKEARENYLKSSGDYTDLVLSKIYDLSLKIKESNESQKIVSFLSELEKRISDAASEMTSEDYFSGEKEEKYLAQDLIVKAFKSQKTEAFNSLDASLEDLSSAVLKFEVMKIGLNAKAIVSAKTCDIKTYDCQKKINEHLKQKEIEKGIKRFREQDLARYDNMIEINKDGYDRMQGGEAFDWVINNN